MREAADPAGSGTPRFIPCPPSRCSEAHIVNRILRPFLSGLQYLHSKGITHRDIKVWLGIPEGPLVR